LQQKKTRRKKLRKKPTTAELIAAMETDAGEGEGEDHGSRREKSVKQRRDEAERSAEVAKRKEGWSKATERAREESRSIYGTALLASGVVCVVCHVVCPVLRSGERAL
jgi:hypothetical protein